MVEVGISARLDRLRTELEKIPGLTTKEVNRAVKGAAKEWTKMPAAARRTAQHTSRQMRSITRSISGISPAAAGASRAIEALGSALGPGMAAVAGPIGLAAAGVAAIGGAGFAAAAKMSKFVDEMGVLAEATGVSQRMVIALRSQVRASGGDFSKTQQALQSFTKTMDLTGKSSEQVDAALLATVRRLEAIESPAERAAERMRIFGTRSASAVAVLTGDSLEAGLQRTKGLAEAVENAAGASARWDAATGELTDRWETFTTKAGTVWAESLLGIADGLSSAVGETDGFADALDSVGPQFAIFSAVLGDTTRLDAWVSRVTGATAAMERAKEARERLERELGIDNSPMPPETGVSWEDIVAAGVKRAKALADAEAAEAAKAAEERRVKAVEAARIEAEAVAKARAEIRAKDRQDAFAAEVAAEAERRAQIEEGRALMAEIMAEDHAARIAQIEEQRIAEAQLAAEMRQYSREAVDHAISGASAVAESAGVVRDAQIGAALAYQAVSIGRTFADLGPLAGLAALPSIIAPMADAIKRAGGSGGGGRRGGGTTSGGASFVRGFGDQGREGGVQTLEYTGRIYDVATRDARRRPGSPLRDIVRQRSVSR